MVILRRVFNGIAIFCIAYYAARGYFRRDETNTATMRVHSSWWKDAKIYSSSSALPLEYNLNSVQLKRDLSRISCVERGYFMLCKFVPCPCTLSQLRTDVDTL